MDGFFSVSITALWFGVLTSISPCPLATNIAAVSYIGKKIERPGGVLVSGLLYALGRTLSYVLLATGLTVGILSISGASFFFQNYFNKIMGPILIISGMFLLEMITVPLPGGVNSEWAKRLAEKNNYSGPVLLGALFALSFCPVSAALFFGSLIPLAVKYRSLFVLSSLYGVGTALPVIVFAILLVSGTRAAGKVFQKITEFEKWLRRTTGIIFIGAGIYFVLIYIFKLNIF